MARGEAQAMTHGRWLFYDLATGRLTGRTLTGPADMLQANTPPGMGALQVAPGTVLDPKNRRVNLDTGEVEATSPRRRPTTRYAPGLGTRRPSVMWRGRRSRAAGPLGTDETSARPSGVRGSSGTRASTATSRRRHGSWARCRWQCWLLGRASRSPSIDAGKQHGAAAKRRRDDCCGLGAGSHVGAAHATARQLRRARRGDEPRGGGGRRMACVSR